MATTAAASISTCARDDDVRARRAAGARAQSRSGDLVVETYVHGNDYRVLVVDGKMAAVAERVPAGVNADGEHTVRQLVELENADPRRGIGHEKVLTRIALNDAALELAASRASGRTTSRPRAPAYSSR